MAMPMVSMQYVEILGLMVVDNWKLLTIGYAEKFRCQNSFEPIMIVYLYTLFREMNLENPSLKRHQHPTFHVFFSRTTPFPLRKHQRRSDERTSP